MGRGLKQLITKTPHIFAKSVCASHPSCALASISCLSPHVCSYLPSTPGLVFAVSMSEGKQEVLSQVRPTSPASASSGAGAGAGAGARSSSPARQVAVPGAEIRCAVVGGRVLGVVLTPCFVYSLNDVFVARDQSLRSTKVCCGVASANVVTSIMYCLMADCVHDWPRLRRCGNTHKYDQGGHECRAPQLLPRLT